MDFSLIKPGWEHNKEIFGDISRADKVKQSLFKIAKNVQELTRLGVIYDIRDGSFSIRGQYYAPYEIVIVSHGGFLETMLEAELGGSKFFTLYSHIDLSMRKQIRWSAKASAATKYWTSLLSQTGSYYIVSF